MSEEPQSWSGAAGAGVLRGIVIVQPVSQSVGVEKGEAWGWGSEQRARGRGWDGTGERGHFKGLSPVSNSDQRDHTMLTSLFSLTLKRGLFVSLEFHCFSVCHSITSGLKGKNGSDIR